MATKSKRLTLLSDAEQFALYGLPDFDDGQQLEYLSLSEAELALACSRPGLHAHASLLCPADRLLQGQARFLPFRLERCRGRLRLRPDPLLHRPGVRAAPHHQT